MKTPTTDAANAIGLHPCEFVMWIASLTDSFDETYPLVDDGYVETLRTMGHERTERPEVPTAALLKARPMREGIRDYSPSTAQIAFVMVSKGFWGTHRVPCDVLKTRLCRDVQDFDDALHELLRGKMILVDRKDHVSLNTKEKAAIEDLAQYARSSE